MTRQLISNAARGNESRRNLTSAPAPGALAARRGVLRGARNVTDRTLHTVNTYI